ncbi:MAG TPA: GNAT family N-acetyltransferase [Mycobacteriales bacterium]|jgi:predicted GNAT family acetyltransferase|nr:GNAT family N-acetyltransferase [Mycobacteriales bacterium]
MATVRNEEQQHRFEIVVDGKVAGFAEYHDRGNRRTFVHTVIDDAYEGQGLGSQLARSALDDARADGRDVVPVCEFVRGYIARHRDEYLDLVPEADREKFDL